MGRINGANSDYKRVGNGIQEVLSNPIFLKIYICPNEQLNPLEEPKDGKKVCEGNSCPDHSLAGHAMIHLNQETGVEIMAGEKNRILVKQNGDIELGQEGAGKARITLKADGTIIMEASTVSINGNLAVSGSYPGQ